MHFLRPVKYNRALLLLLVYVLGIFLNLSHPLNQILEMFELWLDSSVSSEYKISNNIHARCRLGTTFCKELSEGILGDEAASIVLDPSLQVLVGPNFLTIRVYQVLLEVETILVDHLWS